MLAITKELPTSTDYCTELRSFGLHPEEIFFFDIETTGLSRTKSMIYLLGCVSIEGEKRILRQWMAETKEEEEVILQKFLHFCAPFHKILHYNGKHFDLPFAEQRLLKWHLNSPFISMESLDFYQQLRPCKAMLKLSHLHQPDVEEFLFSSADRLHCDGGACIPLYRKYLSRPSSTIAETLLGHNKEDLDALSRFTPILSYFHFLEGDFQLRDVWKEEDSLYCVCELHHSVPKIISYAFSDGYLTLKEQEARFQLHLQNGKLRHRYEDYKNYIYLPGEDSVLPKSMRSFVDASLRLPATKENCYTWFSCSEEFCRNHEEILKYLQHQLFFWLQENQ